MAEKKIETVPCSAVFDDDADSEIHLSRFMSLECYKHFGGTVHLYSGMGGLGYGKLCFS